MALQKTLSLLLLSLLTLLGLGLVQLSYGETMYERFQRQHVDSKQRGVTSLYCNTMMQTRGMTRPRCKQFNTFIHADIGAINNICSTPNIRCKNGRMNCHAGIVRVTDCRLTASSPQNCRYEGRGSFRHVVIACEGNPLVPVHFDS
ncbi:ribonuclease 4-like [Myotis daubentonii]|uniref:ribonuclease 4-like n=1 Tax=Myotis daubentonii TaxID=98922 RepID=UPI00287355A3|nr:ribonuclease 4-like [Myotis daubentonii]XP_059562409.1 ribonuclease 4-like [Myotis daubentonii]XP_059562420.1 ribonuclease 4-like [Myotis daubentonii]XP_059562429.1 ribonuclease 4-like [Myotis daubentonii]XP_059562439.1 ribonuclease 4-like [Myotis daubentonii]